MALTIEGASRSLDARWGDDHADGFPATVTVQLWQGHPEEGGVELDDSDYPGYLAFTVTNNSTNFPAADGGSKSTAELEVCTATDDWVDAPTHFSLADDDDILEVIEIANVEGVPALDDVVTVQGTISRGDV